MDSEEKFKKKVKEKLEKLNKEQVMHFSWRCGVRALPFLGSDGNFNFWKKNDKQKYIYSVFSALDVNAFSVDADVSFDYANAAATTAATAAASAIAVTTTANSAATYDGTATSAAFAFAHATANYTAAAASGACSCASSAASCSICSDSYLTVDRGVHCASCSVTAAAAGFEVLFAFFALSGNIKAAIKENMNLESIILQDLNTIQKKGVWKNQYKLTDLYREIWDNFQKALDAEGCAYWGQLYKCIFDDGLKLDSKALAKRMNVPKEIREHGAAAVANYLECANQQ